jgi:Uma2 family endonuclease
MVMPHTGHFTAADLATMPDDGQRYEVIDGELLVTPAPGGGHQLVVHALFRALDDYLRRHGNRDLMMAPADISFGTATVVQPDLFVGELATFRRTLRWADVRALYLAIEVLSPSTAPVDRGVKRALYQRQGVPQYWIVDMDARQIEVWTPNATSAAVHRDILTWRHPSVATSVTIDVGALFTFE